MRESRFTVKKINGVKIQAHVKGRLVGYYKPTGYGCFDNLRGEFVVFTKERNGFAAFDSYDKKETMQAVVDQFNTMGATFGNDNLGLIKRFRS